MEQNNVFMQNYVILGRFSKRLKWQLSSEKIKRRMIYLSDIFAFFSFYVKQLRLNFVNGFLVSKETVVLRRWESETNLVLSNELIKVELPP